mmetsp:Transcript_15222/g.38115  ORF Transcript_15222/g.38115 Transcript_15222/m.38115 type:complete len:251 (-) Transcript_15222:1115-1867(-)
MRPRHPCLLHRPVDRQAPRAHRPDRAVRRHPLAGRLPRGALAAAVRSARLARRSARRRLTAAAALRLHRPASLCRRPQPLRPQRDAPRARCEPLVRRRRVRRLRDARPAECGRRSHHHPAELELPPLPARLRIAARPGAHPDRRARPRAHRARRQAAVRRRQHGGRRGGCEDDAARRAHHHGLCDAHLRPRYRHAAGGRALPPHEAAAPPVRDGRARLLARLPAVGPDAPRLVGRDGGNPRRRREWRSQG